MTSGTNEIADSLQRLVAESAVTEDALQAMTGIPVPQLRSFLANSGLGMTLSTAPQNLSPDESSRISTLEAQLTEGMRIGDDDRLKAILGSLTIECHLTPANIALLSGLDVEVLEQILDHPSRVLLDERYKVAIRCSYLLNAVNRARRL